RATSRPRRFIGVNDAQRVGEFTLHLKAASNYGFAQRVLVFCKSFGGPKFLKREHLSTLPGVGSALVGKVRHSRWPKTWKVGKDMRPRRIRLIALSFLLLPLLVLGAYADTINMGTAGSYAVLAGSTVTNTGPSVIKGNLGLSAGCAETGFPPGTVHGQTNICNPVAVQAKSDLTTAFNQANGLF